MHRLLLAAALAVACFAAQAQTQFRFTDVTISEKDRVLKGQEAVAQVVGAEGADRVTLYDQDGIKLKSQVRIHTQGSNRSSVKDGAVYATFEIRLTVDGKEDRRTVQKAFYGEQERRTTITEKFTVKRGIDVRVVTVRFSGSLE
jgi:hypothetical protein